MKRILILGCGGSGKSTLARILGDRLRLPVIHLDQRYWRAGWVEPAKAEWRAQVTELTARPQWIMDGNYGGTLADRLAHADMAIAFDFPTWLCFWRVCKRIAKGYGRTRPDLPDGCPEQIDFKFLLYILNFRRKSRPNLMGALAAYSGTKHVLTSPAQVRRFLATLPTSPLPPETPPS